jgi:hypothetical protein
MLHDSPLLCGILRTMPRYPFAEWTAERVRLTVFPLPGAANPNPEHWWEAIVAAPPDESTANLKMGLRTLAGTFHAGKLILRLELNRIDWLLVPQDPDPAVGLSGELPSIGPVTENLELFSGIAERWLSRDDIPDLVVDGIEQKQLPEKCRSKISKPAAPATHRADEPAPPIF